MRELGNIGVHALVPTRPTYGRDRPSCQNLVMDTGDVGYTSNGEAPDRRVDARSPCARVHRRHYDVLGEGGRLSAVVHHSEHRLAHRSPF